jgi:replicative DNA helicase
VNLFDANSLPMSTETEITILGAMLLDQSAREDAAKLDTEDFALDSHQKIFKLITQMQKEGWAIDLLTVMDGAKRSGFLDSIGGPAYLAYLTEGMPRNPAIAHYVRIVKNKSLLRKTLGILNDGTVAAMDQQEDAQSIIAAVQKHLQRVTEGVEVPESLQDQSDAAWARFESQRSGEVKSFVSSGIAAHDETHGGFAIGEMTILAARPKVGKSTALRQSLIENCSNGVFFDLYTLEMDRDQVLRCLWAAVANVSFDRVRYPERCTEKELSLLELAKRVVDGWPLSIDDTPKLRADDIIVRSRARRRKLPAGMGYALGIDYLQKMGYNGRTQDRYGEISSGMNDLTAYARTERVAVLMISSLSEGESKNPNRVPTIHDLRGSGDIKYDANTVLLLHREINAETQRYEPETKLIVGAARADEGGARTIYFDGKMQRFVSLEEYQRRFQV